MSPETASRISVLRPVLIALVVSAHVPWTLYDPTRKDINFTLWNFARLMLTAVMSPIGMPLLSVISGFLVVRSLGKYGYLELVQKKAARIIVPMIFWNFAFATLIYWAQSHGWQSRADLPLFNGNLASWLNALLAIDTIPANGPLYFLRELFICFCLLPALVGLARYRFLSGGVLLASALIIVTGMKIPLIFRFDIYAWFFFGILSSIYGFDKWSVSKKYQNIILVFGLLLFGAVAISYFVLKQQFNYVERLVTLIGPLYFWIFAGAVHKSKAGFVFKKYSKYSFTVFLTHAFVISCCWQTWSIWVGRSPFDNFVTFGFFCTTSVFLVAPAFYHGFYWWLSHIGVAASKPASERI